MNLKSVLLGETFFCSPLIHSFRRNFLFFLPVNPSLFTKLNPFLLAIFFAGVPREVRSFRWNVFLCSPWKSVPFRETIFFYSPLNLFLSMKRFFFVPHESRPFDQNLLFFLFPINSVSFCFIAGWSFSLLLAEGGPYFEDKLVLGVCMLCLGRKWTSAEIPSTAGPTSLETT